MGSSKNAGRRRSVSKMDPDCAICRRPATVRCDCEAKGLEEAVRQAEVKLMSRVYEDIRYVNTLKSSHPSAIYG